MPASLPLLAPRDRIAKRSVAPRSLEEGEEEGEDATAAWEALVKRYGGQGDEHMLRFNKRGDAQEEIEARPRRVRQIRIPNDPQLRFNNPIVTTLTNAISKTTRLIQIRFGKRMGMRYGKRTRGGEDHMLRFSRIPEDHMLRFSRIPEGEHTNKRNHRKGLQMKSQHIYHYVVEVSCRRCLWNRTKEH